MKHGEDLLRELEQIGHEEAHLRLARGDYGSRGIARDTVEDWLRLQSDLRVNSSSRESNRIARQARNIAIAASAIGMISIIWSIVSYFLNRP